jgi:DNA polymerase III epsilon subunit-like protein
MEVAYMSLNKLVKKIISFDAETNGLWGEAFSIAAILYKNGKEEKKFLGRCPINGQVNPFVEKNILPQMKSIAITHNSYSSMLEDFCKFYLAEKENAQVIVHMGLPVEARLFIDAHNMGFIGDWDAPYPLIDISVFPQIGTSVDSYNEKFGISVPDFDGGTHNPLYDSAAAAEAYIHYLKNNG